MDKTIKKELTLEEKELARIRTKEYYDKNKEAILAKKKLFRETYPDKVKMDKKKYNDSNKEKVKEWNAKKYKNTAEQAKEYAKEYRKNNLEKRKLSGKIYRDNNRDKIRKHAKEIRDTNELVRFIDNTRRMIRYSFESKGLKKNNKTELILGCSFEEFKRYIESKWKPWMSWDNYGNPKGGVHELNKTWDIDHIKPLSSAKTIEM